ncbi:MAG: hypothetical protein AAF845_05635 [Bacteroidota bacterium]
MTNSKDLIQDSPVAGSPQLELMLAAAEDPARIEAIRRDAVAAPDPFAPNTPTERKAVAAACEAVLRADPISPRTVAQVYDNGTPEGTAALRLGATFAHCVLPTSHPLWDAAPRYVVLTQAVEVAHAV